MHPDGRSDTVGDEHLVWLNGEPIAVPSVASFSARVKQ